jgi:hypothetical protein
MATPVTGERSVGAQVRGWGFYRNLNRLTGELIGAGAGLHRMAAASTFHFREHWRELKRGRPGHRFQDR